MRLAVIIAIIAAAALLAVLVLLAWDNGDPSGGDPVSMPSPFGEYSPGSVAEVPIRSGYVMFEALGLQTLAEYEAYSVDLMRELGVGWIRVDFLFDGWRFHEPGSLQLFRDAGIAVIGTARPVGNAPSEDLARFQDELAEIVSRYPWIETWQIGNEPNIGWSPGDYIRLFLAGEQAVREQCPGCTVMLAGVAARYPSHEEAIDYYSEVFAGIEAAYDGPGGAFDAFDIHYYGYYGADEEISGLIDRYRNTLADYGYAGAGLWVTETSTFSGSPSTLPASMAQTEEQQASELVRRFVVMLNSGVTQVAWSRPYENYRYREVGGGYYDHNALVYNGLGAESLEGIAAGTPKLSFHAYQTLIDKLAGFDAVERVAPGQYRFRFDNGHEPVYVAWAAGGTTVLVEPAGRVMLTDIDGSTSYSDAAGVLLTEKPVIVEEDVGGGP